MVSYDIFDLVETLVCDHSRESPEQKFHVSLFIMLHKVGKTFKAVDKTLGVHASEQKCLRALFIKLHKTLTIIFTLLNTTLVCGHFNMHLSLRRTLVTQ